MHRVVRRFVVLAGLACFTLGSAPTRTDRLVRKIGSMKLLYAGLSATVDPPSPVVPKNTPAGVRIVVTAGGEELSAAAAVRFFGGSFLVEGDLSGPALPGARTLRSRPSELVLPIPALELSGNYTLSNVRILVENVPVLDVTPSSVIVDVIEQVLVTSVKTRPLTLDELRARGVVLDGDDVLGFEFTLAMMLESKPIHISFPVAFDRQGVPVPQPLSPPLEPTRTGVAVDVPPLPTLVPLMLEAEDEGELPEIELPDGTVEPIRIPSVLVFPGDVGYLKQFLSAQLFVANGTPAFSRLLVRDIQATIELPQDDSLALAELQSGTQPSTLPILGVGPDGEPGTTDDLAALAPGEQGQAEFLVRGEKEGFHTLSFDIDAILEGLKTGDVKLKGRASGGVLVRKPFFDLTFTVPSVVRTDEEFELLVSVHNIGEGIANRVDVSFDERALSGLELSAGAPKTMRIDTLQPGDFTTLAFDFKSLRTGQVTASYLRFDGDSLADGDVHFSLGVADGVPLSPDTLVLPKSAEALDPAVLRAGMRVLGQAWSIARAPAGTLAPGIRRIRTNVVIEKALLLAEAGLRAELGEPHDSAVRGLLFDFYGGSPLDQGFDQLLRTMSAGQAFRNALALELEDSMAASGGATGYERESALVAASGNDFVSFAVDSTGVELTLTDGSGREASSIPGYVPLVNAEGTFGVLTAPTSSPYSIALTPREAASTSFAVTLPRGDGTFVRGTGPVDLAPTHRARVTVDLFRPDDLALESDGDGDGIFETRTPLSTETIRSEGPKLLSATLIGPELFDGASAFGLHAAALFDRIVDKAQASDRARYRVPDNTIAGARRQLSGRLVFLTLAQPEGPYEATTLEAIEIEDLRGVARTRTVSLTSRLADPGAVVTGRVFQAGGSPIASGFVSYANFRSLESCTLGEELVFAEVPLGPDGSYAIRYVRRDPCGGPFRVLYRDPGTGELRDVRGYVRAPGERIRLDLALFGRGNVTGTIYENGVAAANANVVVTSATEVQSGAVTRTDGNGRYTVYDIVVGPVSVKAARGIAIGANSGRIARAGITAVVDVVLDPGKVRVSGVVSKLESGSLAPLGGAQVVYSIEVPGRFAPLPVGVARTAANGSYALEDLPFGDFTLEAILDANARASVQAISAPGDDRVENLVIAIPAPTELGTVSGRVVLPDETGVPGAVVGVGTREVLSGGDGVFVIPGLPVKPGESQLVVARTADGKRQGQGSVVISDSGQVVSNVRIPLSGLGRIDFTVRDANENPVKGQLVGLLGTCENACGCFGATTDQTGKASFSNVPVGTHFAKAVLVGAGFVDVAIGSARVEKEGDVGLGVLRFAGVGTVTGKVFLPGAVDPALGSDVTLTSRVFNRDACELERGVSHRGRTDQNGEFTFANVSFGQVSVTATHPFADKQVGATATLTKANPVDFELVLVDTTAGVVSGTVYLPDGVTPAGAGVEVKALGPLPEVEVRTGEDGGYRFRAIFPQGMYTFTVTDPITGFAAREQLFLRSGMDTGHDFRLKGRGTVRVRVVDAADNPVESAFVKLTESDFPGNVFERVLTPASQGVATFERVFEGRFHVEARDVFGRDGGRVPSTVPSADAEVELVVRLNAVGAVEGTFLLPDGATPIPFGVVELLSGGQVLGQATTAGAGDVGSFVFDYVPIGDVRLEALDPLTARHGFATGKLVAQDEVLPLDVVAQGLGRVEGTVRANGVPQNAAQVELVSGSFRASTSADDDGFYFLEGVPEGQVVVTASLANGFLKGTNAGTLLGNGALLILDVALRDSVAVTGRVMKAGPVGSTGPAPPSIVTISAGGAGGGSQSTTTDPLDGSFRFERVPAGQATLEVAVLGSIDRARRILDLAPGETVDLLVALNGVGSIAGEVRDGGVPVAGKLTLRGIGSFSYTHVFTVGAGGEFFLPEVLAGPVTATFELTGPPKRFGTATGVLSPDTTLDLPVTVEPSGKARGLVRLPTRAPAVGANVLVLLSGNRGVVTTQTNDAGEFEVEGIPLGTFDIRVEDPFTGGVGFANGLELAVPDEEITGLVIDLDDSPVRVLAVDPPDGAIDVLPSQVVRITFSDPVAALNNALTIKAGSTTLNLVAQLAPDGLSATLSGTLPDAKLLTVQVTTSLVDLFGRRPVAVFTSTLRTVDLSPPKALSTFPEEGAFQVESLPIVVVTFDEPLSDATDFASLVSLLGPGGAVAGASERLSAAEARFTPGVSLEDNAVYQIVVNGAVDDLGNTQTAPVTVARFATNDTAAPTLILLSPPAWTSQLRPGIQLQASDNASGIDPASATLKLDAAPVTPIVVGDRIVFTPETDLAEGPHPVMAAVADRAANVGGFSGAFHVDRTPPSVAILTSPAAGATLQGIVRFEAAATDAPPSGLARIDLRYNGSFFASLPQPAFALDFDTTRLPEGDLLLTARAVDLAGNLGPESDPVPVKVDNRAIGVTFDAPVANLRVRDSVEVRVRVSEPVERVEFEVGTVKVVDPTFPYQAVLDLASVAEGPQKILATAFSANDNGFAERPIVIDRTPPPPPRPDLVFAEPPVGGASLVHGLGGAVEKGAVLDAVNLSGLDTGATASTTAAADGSFSMSLLADVGDLVSLTATDDLGNRGAATHVVVRSIPSLPPSDDAARLRFEGVVADRVGLSTLVPDGNLDAVFTLKLTLGDGVTRDLKHIDLDGPASRSTRAAVGAVLGVAPGPSDPFLNDSSGEVSFPITGEAELILVAADEGFIVEGETYTVTAVFVDGARLVGSVTIVPTEDRTGVPHSLRISATPPTVAIPSGGEGTTTLLVDDIRDIDGTPVPDGVRVALAVEGMATVDPFGRPVPSGGGKIEGGVPAANDARFQVFLVEGGAITAEYRSDTVVPQPFLGTAAVVSTLAADETGNVLGNQTIGTLDLNLRAAADAALVHVEPSSLYSDEGPRRASVRVQVTNPAILPDGTRVILSATFCVGRNNTQCVESFGGRLLGSPFAVTDPDRPRFEVQGGQILAEYEVSTTASVGPGEIRFANIQVVPNAGSQQVFGTGTMALVGAGGAEIDVSPESIPLVTPERSVQVRVRHVHDARGNLVPDDAKILLSVEPTFRCATTVGSINGPCSVSDGGAIVDGASSPHQFYRLFALAGGTVNATYKPLGVSPTGADAVHTAGVQLAMGDFAGNLVNRIRIGYRAVPLLAPAHTVGVAEPSSLLADGNLNAATVTFTSFLDAFGNPLPDGTPVAASTLNNAYRLDGVVIPSTFGAMILNGGDPPSGTHRLFTVEDGMVNVQLAMNAFLAAGRVDTVNLMLLPASSSGAVVGTEVLGVVPVPLPAVSSATAVASPTVLDASGADHRSSVTLSNIRDALGRPVPDGTIVATTADFQCWIQAGPICVLPSIGATIQGGAFIAALPAFREFTTSGGQVVAELSTSGINISSGFKTAIVRAVALPPSRSLIGRQALASVEVDLVPAGSDRVIAAPVGLFVDGREAMSSITVLLPSVADGTQVALTVADCAAENTSGVCIASAGGILSAEGTSPGDGTPSNGDDRFRLFTVAGGQVKAHYIVSGLWAAVGETKLARVSVVAADGLGNVVSLQALATGEVRLRGASVATANGRDSLPKGGKTATITFAGIKDSLGNDVPDGTIVLVTAASCGTRDSNGNCHVSIGGTLLDGSPSSAGPDFRAYSVTDGNVTVTYSTPATTGTARIQMAPATHDGTLIGDRILLGGVHLLFSTQ